MTDHDYASKEWLRTEPDAFQLISPDLAIFLLVVGFFLGYLLGSFK